ncbi:MAG TPA: LamG-like jellyroll fold domain-containing protein [Thermoguttaceae bacterium]|nr:LamG-like jellyroll fold domain-containing protein [Thermoguttaceae bacterium]
MTRHRLGPIGAMVIMVACLMVATTSHAALSDNLTLYSTMNNVTAPAQANYWQDVSGNGFHAQADPPTYDGTPDVGGTNRGTAVDFVTTITPETQFNSQQITFANGLDPNLDPGTTDFSFSFWYNQPEADAAGETAARYLLSKGNYSQISPGFGVYTKAGALTIRSEDAGGDPLDEFQLQHVAGLPGLETPVNLVGTGWHHVTGVFDRTGTYGAVDSVTLYVDGTAVNSGVLPTVGELELPNNISAPTNAIRIAGKDGVDTTRDFEGYMDDVAFYRGALSPTQVQTLYTATSFNASTISDPNITPVFVHNFETNLHVAPSPATVPDVYGAPDVPGVIHGDVTQVTDGTRGEVLSVNTRNVNNYVDFGDNFDPGATSHTVSVWVKPDGGNTATEMFATKGNRSTAQEGWSMSYRADGKVGVRGTYFIDGTAYKLNTVTETAISAGEWHHVALVIDQDTGLWEAFIDGVGSGLDGDNGLWNCDEVNYAVTFPTGGSVGFDSTYSLMLGRSGDGNALFQGDLDDFAIWNRALTSTEISAIYGGANLLPSVTITVPGDTDGDDDVDPDDAGTLASNWGAAVTNGAWDGDFNADGAVNALDASILAANWTGVLESAGQVGVPEPGTLVLLMGLACLATTLRGRKE